METVFKNEIKKSRSLHFSTIFGQYMAKYNHLLHYPFRDRALDKCDLLKPKATFYFLAVVCAVSTVWMVAIFATGILESATDGVSSIAFGVYAGVTLCIALVSTGIILVAINRLFRLYEISIKNAFKVHYGADFVPLDEGLQEYKGDEDSEESYEMPNSSFQRNSTVPNLHSQQQPNLPESSRKLLLNGDQQPFERSAFADDDQADHQSSPPRPPASKEKMMEMLKKKSIKDILSL